MVSVIAPLTGTVVSVAAPGQIVPAGEAVAILESMKMEHTVAIDETIVVERVNVQPGDRVDKGLELATGSATSPADAETSQPTRTHDRASLIEVVDRHNVGLDPARPGAVAKRHRTGRRTARENLDDLVDADSFVEYGPLTIAAQRQRRDVAELIKRTPADGLVGGIGTVNADIIDRDTRCVVASYDYMVLAGTQGMVNHRKKDRLFELAERMRLPVVLFTEGGGGRPGDVDMPGVSWLDCIAFALFGGLAGTVPTIGVNAGYCFAGNAALLGTCDVVIATEDSNIGMAGPAMIAGGGLGDFAPTDIGPAEVHAANGVVDVVATDEAEATAVARKVLAFAQGRTAGGADLDPSRLREAVPENRREAYDMHVVIDALVDVESAVEFREHWNPAMITTMARVHGNPLGIIANNSLHLAGAIDHGAATKAAEFMELCESWKLPILFLCDTPGFMVGPDSDAQGLPRSAGRLFRVGANLTVPFGTVITRRGYGLGAQAMAGGGFKEPLFTVSWPTGEFGPMGLEGAVRLGFSKELAAAPQGPEREALFEQLLDTMIHHGKATNVASHFEIDDAIDPADTRRWVDLLFDRAHWRDG